MHIYANGRHPGDLLRDGSHMTGGLTDRNGIPFGTWQFRFIDWFRDLGFLQRKPRPDIVNLRPETKPTLRKSHSYDGCPGIFRPSAVFRDVAKIDCYRSYRLLDSVAAGETASVFGGASRWRPVAARSCGRGLAGLYLHRWTLDTQGSDANCWTNTGR
jgi:hypothetical protein